MEWAILVVVVWMIVTALFMRKVDQDILDLKIAYKSLCIEFKKQVRELNDKTDWIREKYKEGK